jgi:hypothetical protein
MAMLSLLSAPFEIGTFISAAIEGVFIKIELIPIIVRNTGKQARGE